MPAETSIPCCKRARDRIRAAKGDLTYSEYILQTHPPTDSEEN